MENIDISEIEKDLDFIILKTKQLLTVVTDEQYHKIETKELVRKQLINQFFLEYSPEQIAMVGEKFEYLIALSTELTQLCEAIFSQTKQDILKIKQTSKIKKAYR